jgi:hypothetical protein
MSVLAPEFTTNRTPTCHQKASNHPEGDPHHGNREDHWLATALAIAKLTSCARMTSRYDSSFRATALIDVPPGTKPPKFDTAKEDDPTTSTSRSFPPSHSRRGGPAYDPPPLGPGTRSGKIRILKASRLYSCPAPCRCGADRSRIDS